MSFPEFYISFNCITLPQSLLLKSLGSSWFLPLSLHVNSNHLFHIYFSFISWLNPPFLSLFIFPIEGTISSILYYCGSFLPAFSSYTFSCVWYPTTVLWFHYSKFLIGSLWHKSRFLKVMLKTQFDLAPVWLSS